MKPTSINIKELKTGDVFLQHTGVSRYKPLTWFSGLIRIFTKSNRNHTSECLIINGQPYMIESLAHGITLRSWQQRLNVSTERDLMRLRKKDPFYTDEKDYIIKALGELDKKYDVYGIIRMFVYIVFGKRNDGKETSQNERRCSEYTARMKDLKGWEKRMPKDFIDNNDFEIKGV